MTVDTDLEMELDILREHVFGSLEKAQAQKTTLKRNNARHTTANIILSVLATLLAGTAGIFGSVGNWKATCLLAAVCSAGATVAAKISTAEQLTNASECVGQLKALRVETILPNYDLDDVSEKYQQILSEFSSIDC